MAVWDEFDFIARQLRPLTDGAKAALGLEDDAAILLCDDYREGHCQVISKDILIEGVHFHTNDPAFQIGQKCLRVNLSDLAAMGATPRAYFLGCAWNSSWKLSHVEAFVDGLAADQKEFGLSLLGGDTTTHEGAAVFSITIIGEAVTGSVLRRNGAKIGDDLYVTGTIGDAGLGLKILGKNFQNKNHISDQDKIFLVDRYRLPQPRLKEAQSLRDVSTAALDISDGLIADAGCMAKASGCQLILNLKDTPLSRAAQNWLVRQRDQEKALLEISASGDDYELLFSAPKKARVQIGLISEDLNLPITRVGTVAEGVGVEVIGSDGDRIDYKKAGYRHSMTEA